MPVGKNRYGTNDKAAVNMEPKLPHIDDVELANLVADAEGSEFVKRYTEYVDGLVIAMGERMVLAQNPIPEARQAYLQGKAAGMRQPALFYMELKDELDRRNNRTNDGGTDSPTRRPTDRHGVYR